MCTSMSGKNKKSGRTLSSPDYQKQKDQKKQRQKSMTEFMTDNYEK